MSVGLLMDAFGIIPTALLGNCIAGKEVEQPL
jgi:hypothetical protein